MTTLTNEQKDTLVTKILDVLAHQSTITAQGRDYNGELDWALTRLLNIIEEQLERQRMEIRGELAEKKRQYDEICVESKKRGHTYSATVYGTGSDTVQQMLNLPSLNPKNE